MKRIVILMSMLIFVAMSTVFVNASEINQIVDVTVDQSKQSIIITAHSNRKSSVVVAFYNEEGRMLSLCSYTAVFDEDSPVSVKLQDKVSDCSCIKAFLVNSSTMSPVAAAWTKNVMQDSSPWSEHIDETFYQKIAAEYDFSYNSEEKALIIETASQLAAFAAFTNADASNTFSGKYVALNSDINISKHEWNPISAPDSFKDGDASFMTDGGFEGTFLGQSHTISGLYYNHDDGCIFGLFGALADGAVVRDVNISGEITGYWNIGGIAAYNYGTISNCVSDIAIYGKGLCIAGIVGQSCGGKISNCISKGSIKGVDDSGNIGGIVGWMGYSTVENCKNYGDIVGGYRIGGIAGRLADKGRIVSCDNYGNYKASSFGEGPIAGVADGDNCEIIETN